MSLSDSLSSRQVDFLLTLDRTHVAMELLRGLAHGLRNHLQVVALGSGLGGDPSEARVERAIDDMSDMLQLLGQLGRHPEGELPIAPLGPTLAMVEELADLQRNAPSVPVEFLVPEDGPALAMPQPALVQVLLNLVFNAKEVSAGSDRPVVLAVEVPGPGGFLQITIDDWGPGPDQVDGRPLQSSRPPSTHGGLGLFASRILIERHGGTLAFAPGAESGTRARLRIPTIHPVGRSGG